VLAMISGRVEPQAFLDVRKVFDPNYLQRLHYPARGFERVEYSLARAAENFLKHSGGVVAGGAGRCAL
jgi:hypothetical protein